MFKGRLGLILPFVGFGVLFALYTVLWHRSADVMEAEIAAFAEREAAAGRSFSYSGVEIEGYPLSLRGMLSDVAWDGGLHAFAAQEVAIVTLPYDPSRILFQPRGEKALTFFGQEYDLKADDLRFSLEREFSAAEAHGVVLSDENGEVVFRDLVMNRQKLAGGESIAFSLQGLQFPEEQVTIHTIDIAGSRVQGGLAVKGLGIRIASEGVQMPTEIVGEGEAFAGEDGLLDGAFTLTFQREDAAIDAMEKFGVLSGLTSQLASQVLGLYSSKGEEPVELPMTITDGRVKLGSIPVTTLPPVVEPSEG
ncbi:DUF2125 domain-containing protein [Parvularcula maris]|uniref:DUF2125 domain-containing protein n=1 Tax=Parvularcula maris TaxID=2965077 RepID=A0A9X2RKJ5_9PROT|nr:DUF2125 domain-containing protein [Parvularcula maris]MCQ8185853.1 DUF2125 domain-containing protein [Parvularcula maris]